MAARFRLRKASTLDTPKLTIGLKTYPKSSRIHATT